MTFAASLMHTLTTGNDRIQSVAQEERRLRRSPLISLLRHGNEVIYAHEPLSLLRFIRLVQG
jgi:hypothetical protein